MDWFEYLYYIQLTNEKLEICIGFWDVNNIFSYYYFLKAY